MLNLFPGGAGHPDQNVGKPRRLREADRRRGVPEPRPGSPGRGPRPVAEHAQHARRDAAPDDTDAEVLPAHVPGSFGLYGYHLIEWGRVLNSFHLSYKEWLLVV